MNREEYRTLSAPAIRLLGMLLLLGREANVLPKKEVMRLAGFTDRSNFRKARLELEEKGFVAAARRDTYSFSSALSSAMTSINFDDNDQDMTRSDLSYLSYLSAQELNQPAERIYRPGVVPATTSPSGTTNHNEVEGTTNEVPGTTRGTHNHNEVPPTTNEVASTTFLERCRDVDEMDASGPETSRQSPFYRRRQAQLPLVQEVWRELFPMYGALLEPDAKKYLSWCDNSVEQLYIGMNTVVKRAKEPVGKPIRFMDKSLRSWALNEMGKQPTPAQPAQRPTSSTPAPQPPKMSVRNQIVKGDSITGDELIPVSDEERARMREFSKKMESLF